MELVGQTIQLADGRRGTIRFAGQTLFAPGEWIGVELETATGKNDGSVQGERYFDCDLGYGMFLRPGAVTVVAAASEDEAEEEPQQPVPSKAVSAARHTSVGSVGTGRKPGSRPSSVFAPATGNRTSVTGTDPGLAKRMSLNAPSPSPVPRPRSRPSSIARSPTKSPTKQLASGHSSTGPSRTGTPSGASRNRMSVGGPRTSMGPPPTPAARPGRTSLSTAARPSSSTTVRVVSGRLGGAGAAMGTARPGMRAVSSSRAASGTSRGTRASVASPPKSSDEEVVSPQPRHPVRTRAAALEKLTAGPSDASGSAAAAAAAPAAAAATASTRPVTGSAAQREIEDLKAKLRVLERKRLEDRDRLKQLDKMQGEVDKYQGIIQKMQAKYQPQQQENVELRRQLKEAEERMESIETLQAEHDTAMELATLDREMAEETAEVYKAELEAVKLKNEELEVDVEELRLENAEMSEGMTSEEKASAGWLQMERNNERLRSALVRLRDMTQQQEEELRDQIRGLEEDVGELAMLRTKHEGVRTKLAQSEAVVEDLRQQLDAAQGADDMIMELTERNMRQAEEVEELRAVIQDLESLREIGDELEANHVQNERELQEEIDFKTAVVQEQARRMAQQEETMEDREYTLSRFRQMVTGLQGDLEDMRASHAVTEGESERLSGASRAMLDLNAKLQLSAAKAQVKTIELELRRLDAEEAAQHLAIARLFLPEAYAETDGQAVLALLRFRRVAFKAELLGGFVRERLQVSDGGHEEEAVAGCAAADRLTWVAAMCGRFTGAMGRCSAARFGRFGGAAPELEPVERSLNGWIEGLRRDELREAAMAAALPRTMAVLGHLGEVYLRDGPAEAAGSEEAERDEATEENERVEDAADEMHMRAVLVQSHLEAAAGTLHAARAMVQRVVGGGGDEDDKAHEFARRAEAAIGQTRSAKVVAGKAVRALEELQARALAVVPAAGEVFGRCETAAAELMGVAATVASALQKLVEAADDGGGGGGDDKTVAYDDVLAAVRTAEGESGGELFAVYTRLLRTVAAQVAELAELAGVAGDLSQTVEFERAAAPWEARSRALRAPKAGVVEAEDELRRVREEHAEARRTVARRDNELGTAQLKIETLEARMRDWQAKAAERAALERAVAAGQAAAAALREDVQKQDRELKVLEAERDRWKKVAEEGGIPEEEEEEEGEEGDEGGHNEGEGEGDGYSEGDADDAADAPRRVRRARRGGDKTRKHDKGRRHSPSRELVLRDDVASLQAAVRFLRDDSRRARVAEQAAHAWLAEPLRTRAARRPTEAVAAEARDALGALVHLAGGARVYDLAQLPADRLAWRPAHTSPGYHAARQAEDYAAWRSWEAAVVRQARQVGTSEAPGRRRRRLPVYQLPALDKVATGAVRIAEADEAVQ